MYPLPSVLSSDAARCGGAPLARDEDVLVRKRYAEQRPGLAARPACVGCARLRQRGVRPDVEKRVQILVRV